MNEQPNIYDDTPPEFLCPIRFDIMTDPVTTESGHSYGRAAITEWLINNDCDPLTKQKITLAGLRPNRALKDTIEAQKKAKEAEKKIETAERGPLQAESEINKMHLQLQDMNKTIQEKNIAIKEAEKKAEEAEKKFKEVDTKLYMYQGVEYAQRESIKGKDKEIEEAKKKIESAESRAQQAETRALQTEKQIEGVRLQFKVAKGKIQEKNIAIKEAEKKAEQAEKKAEEAEKKLKAVDDKLYTYQGIEYVQLESIKRKDKEIEEARKKIESAESRAQQTESKLNNMESQIQDLKRKIQDLEERAQKGVSSPPQTLKQDNPRTPQPSVPAQSASQCPASPSYTDRANYPKELKDFLQRDLDRYPSPNQHVAFFSAQPPSYREIPMETSSFSTRQLSREPFNSSQAPFAMHRSMVDSRPYGGTAPSFLSNPWTTGRQTQMGTSSSIHPSSTPTRSLPRGFLDSLPSEPLQNDSINNSGYKL